MRFPRALAAALLLCGSAAAQSAPPRRPELRLTLDDDSVVAGWASAETFAFRSTLGSHDITWADVSEATRSDGRFKVRLRDGSAVTGTFEGAEFRLVVGRETERAVPVASVRSLVVEMRTAPSGATTVEVLAVTPEHLSCAGAGLVAGGRLVCGDREGQCAVFLDPATLREASRSPLPAPLTSLRVSPDGTWVLAVAGTDLVRIDAASGAVSATVSLDAAPTDVAILDDDRVVASRQNETVVASFSLARVVARDAVGVRKITATLDDRRILTESGIWWIDPEADGRSRPVAIQAVREQNSEGDPGPAFVSPDRRLAVAARGVVYRLGSGGGAPCCRIAAVPKHTAGMFGPDGATLFLFHENGQMSTVETAGWTVTRTSTLGRVVVAALPTDGGRAACLLAADPGGIPPAAGGSWTVLMSVRLDD